MRRLAATLLIVSLASSFLFSGCKSSKKSPEASSKAAKETVADVSEIKKTVSNAKYGESFTLGRFEQDGNEKNGAEPIEWIVVKQDEGKALVCSRYVLAYRPFQETPEGEDSRWVKAIWPESNIRTWLNEDFLKSAFTDEEKALLLSTKHTTTYLYDYQVQNKENEDTVFLLSVEETMKYMFNNGNSIYGIPTEAVLKDKPYMSDVEGADGIKQAMSWWLRDSGDNTTLAADVPGYDKKANTYGSAVSGKGGVRPAMWIVWDSEHMKAYEKGEAKPKDDADLNAKIAALKVGDTIEMGIYDVNPRANDGYEHLTWTVLEEDSESFILILKELYWYDKFSNKPSDELSRMTDSGESFNWEVSDLRATLNSSEFMNSIFTPAEKSKIMLTHVTAAPAGRWERDIGKDTDDYLYIPSREEIEKWFPNQQDRGLKGVVYWLRSTDFVVPYMTCVIESGEITNQDAGSSIGVRLVMRIKKA